MKMNHLVSRFFASFIMAVGATAGLLWVMQALIQMEDMELDESERGAILTFEPKIDDISLEIEPNIIEPPERPQIPPETPQQIASVPGPTLDYGIHKAINLKDSWKPTPGKSMPDGGALAIVKVTPQYPRSASERGIEGFVVVQFTISKTGEVLTPVVVAAAPSSIFNRSALRAVAKFKYKPKVVNGETVSVPNVLHRIVYELEKV